MFDRNGSRKVLVFIITLSLCLLATGCSAPAQTSRHSPSASSVASHTAPKTQRTYQDIPTPYPNLYSFDANSGLKNVYNESAVVDWSSASAYVGKSVTVEGYADSVIFAGSTNGAPYFFNLGVDGYTPGGFVAVVWSQDLAWVDEFALSNFVQWSMSGQPISCKFRVSGVVEAYGDRYQITVRDGTQIATQMDDGTWFNMISDSSMDALMSALYE